MISDVGTLSCVCISCRVQMMSLYILTVMGEDQGMEVQRLVKEWSKGKVSAPIAWPIVGGTKFHLSV